MSATKFSSSGTAGLQRFTVRGSRLQRGGGARRTVELTVRIEAKLRGRRPVWVIAGTRGEIFIGAGNVGRYQGWADPEDAGGGPEGLWVGVGVRGKWECPPSLTSTPPCTILGCSEEEYPGLGMGM